MSYHSENNRLKPVLDLVRQLDIATNPHPQAPSSKPAMEAFKSGVRRKTTRKTGMGYP